MVLARVGELELRDVELHAPREGEVTIAIEACGVCRTDLHVIDGELANPKLPLILGHEIVGRVLEVGAGVTTLAPQMRVGVPWLGWTCGQCRYCRECNENLCDHAGFTGYTIDGGYAEATVADARYVFRVPEGPAERLAPLLCAGLIGYRTYRFAHQASRIGIYGFGAAAHLIAQLAIEDGREVYAFTRPGDVEAQTFARVLGAIWAGPSSATPPVELDAALIFAPVGALVPVALAAVRKGGVVVCGGIHMSDIPSFPYSLLWGERSIRSVANLTRRDGEELLARVARSKLEASVTTYPLARALDALNDLRRGTISGAAVLVP
jgi:propanol-preferring alcohol dehydrogenase